MKGGAVGFSVCVTFFLFRLLLLICRIFQVRDTCQMVRLWSVSLRKNGSLSITSHSHLVWACAQSSLLDQIGYSSIESLLCQAEKRWRRMYHLVMVGIIIKLKLRFSTPTRYDSICAPLSGHGAGNGLAIGNFLRKDANDITIIVIEWTHST